MCDRNVGNNSWRKVRCQEVSKESIKDLEYYGRTKSPQQKAARHIRENASVKGQPNLTVSTILSVGEG